MRGPDGPRTRNPTENEHKQRFRTRCHSSQHVLIVFVLSTCVAVSLVQTKFALLLQKNNRSTRQMAVQYQKSLSEPKVLQVESDPIHLISSADSRANECFIHFIQKSAFCLASLKYNSFPFVKKKKKCFFKPQSYFIFSHQTKREMILQTSSSDF